MGFYLHLVTAVLQREGDQFIQRNEVSRFGDKVYVAWCRSPKGPLPPGWVAQADGTLRVQFRPDRWLDHVEHETTPVDAGEEPGSFSYEEQFDMPYGEPGLFHLVLPPRHLPRLDSLQPLPAYARPEGERFVMGWIQQARTWIRFTFEEVAAESFSKKAARLRQAIVRRQSAAVGHEEELGSIEAQLRTWQGNLCFLEERAALYGIDVPLYLHNQIEQARAQIAALTRRRATLLGLQ